MNEEFEAKIRKLQSETTLLLSRVDSHIEELTVHDQVESDPVAETFESPAPTEIPDNIFTLLFGPKSSSECRSGFCTARLNIAHTSCTLQSPCVEISDVAGFKRNG